MDGGVKKRRGVVANAGRLVRGLRSELCILLCVLDSLLVLLELPSTRRAGVEQVKLRGVTTSEQRVAPARVIRRGAATNQYQSQLRTSTPAMSDDDMTHVTSSLLRSSALVHLVKPYILSCRVNECRFE